MGEVVDDEDVGGGEEDGGHVADDDLAMQVVQLRDRAVDDESDEEEEAGDGSADRVDQPQDAGNTSHLENAANISQSRLCNGQNYFQYQRIPPQTPFPTLTEKGKLTKKL